MSPELLIAVFFLMIDLIGILLISAFLIVNFFPGSRLYRLIDQSAVCMGAISIAAALVAYEHLFRLDHPVVGFILIIISVCYAFRGIRLFLNRTAEKPKRRVDSHS